VYNFHIYFIENSGEEGKCQDYLSDTN